ncbi:MAG: OB-fold nucleic acid binding domain-containing protein [Promethearchaeota archaeon]
MSDLQRKRLPAIRCWIKHIVEGKFSIENNMLRTIFGTIKRVRIYGTIIEKRIKVSSHDSSSQYNNKESNVRIEFDIDDGTGLIQANKWDINPELYNHFEKGSLVEIIGLISYKYETISISIEIMKNIENVNIILLRDSEMIKKLKSYEKHFIEENDLDSELKFLTQPVNNSDDFKGNVLSIIEKFSRSERGISFKKLLQLIDIPEEKLRRHIRELEMESKIYQSEENIYQSYLP